MEKKGATNEVNGKKRKREVDVTNIAPIFPIARVRKIIKR